MRGLDNAATINSTSHGTGWRMSRNEAFRKITKTQREAYLKEKGVTLLGGGLGEAPQAYKDINEVINAKSELVEVIARLKPRIVMMTDEPRDV